MTTFALEPIYGSILLAILIAGATVALIVLVTPPTSDPIHRRWLIVLRSIAATALILALVGPALVQTDKRPAKATLVVAADVSRSMTLPDGDGGDRWTSQVDTWRELSAGLAGLDESLSVRLLVYEGRVRTLSDAGVDALDEESPDGDLTDLGAATLASIQAAEGQPIAGVVLMGDGTQTAPIQGTGAQRIVETLNSLGVPLWCVPLGPAGGTESRDVAVETLPESYQLFAGNEVNIDFQVESRGLAGVDIPVSLTWIDAQGRSEEAARRMVVAKKSNDVQALTIPVIAPAPGSYRLKVQAKTQSGELVTVNNSQTAFVDVREGGGRILYLEGTVREEQSLISRTLRRLPDLDLTYQWIPTDTASSWPIDLDNWFRRGRFDVYIIGDLDADAIGQDQLKSMAEAVDAGAGLVMLGGYQTYGAGGYAGTPLAEAMPIRMDPSLRRSLDAPRDDKGQLPGPLSPILARSHPTTDLGGDDPAEIWRQLPPLLGANRFLGAKVAPGVQVLLKSPEEDPLLVVGEYGRGRTAAVAFDSTYRWWRAGQRDVHKRFWRQLILWLLAREDSGGDKIVIELDSRRFDYANPPEFRAGVQSLAGVADDVTLIAEIVDSAGKSTTVPVSSQSDGSMAAAVAGKIPELAPGFYQLRVRSADDSSTLVPGEVAFQTIDQSRELARPMADPVYLRQLAQLTADHGGAAFSPDEVDALIDTIAKRRRQAETPIVEKYRLGDGPISGWIVFVIFASALAGEWFLRRRWGIA